jgi:SM-20-related protein
VNAANPICAAPPNTTVLAAIVDELARCGHVVCDNAIDNNLLSALYQRVRKLPDNAFHAAGVGRAHAHRLNTHYRSDRIHWLSASDPTEARWLAWAETLRTHINQQLFMGLSTYEAHFAHYAPGQLYQRHVDAFRGQANRVLSTVLYLNPTWSQSDGGELVLYPSNNTPSPASPVTVMPCAARLVVFLSEDLPHEVLPAQRDRYSIAGWFRVRTAGLP